MWGVNPLIQCGGVNPFIQCGGVNPFIQCGGLIHLSIQIPFVCVCKCVYAFYSNISKFSILYTATVPLMVCMHECVCVW